MNAIEAILLSTGLSCSIRVLTTIYKYCSIRNRSYKLQKISFANILTLAEINSIKDFIKVLLPMYGIFNELENIVMYEQDKDKYIQRMRDTGIIISKYSRMTKENNHVMDLSKSKSIKSKIDELRDYRENIINNNNDRKSKILSIKKTRKYR